MNTRTTILAAILAAALPVAALPTATPVTGESNPARVQVVDKASADAQAKSAKQGAKAAKAGKRAKKTVRKTDKPAAVKAG
jgi:hypothetical protein